MLDRNASFGIDTLEFGASWHVATISRTGEISSY
jgi:hypothetical protein